MFKSIISFFIIIIFNIILIINKFKHRQIRYYDDKVLRTRSHNSVINLPKHFVVLPLNNPNNRLLSYTRVKACSLTFSFLSI